MNDELLDRAIELVKSKIKGERKGRPNIPAYQHSLRVSDILRDRGFDHETCIAGLLHDVIEDGEMTFDELVQEDFSKRIIDLVRLCTHDVTIGNKDRRWLLMMGRLAGADDSSAWGIKIADLFDNVRDSSGLSLERQSFMLNVKAPLMLAVTKDVTEVSTLRRELEVAVREKNAAFPIKRD